MKNCLIVIDAQESFRHRPYYTAHGMPAYLAAQNALIAGCVARGVPVVRILHVDGPAAADNAFALESGYVRPIEGLADFAAAATFYKSRHSALVGTGLDVWLRQNRLAKSSSAASAPSNAARPPRGMRLTWDLQWTMCWMLR